CAAERRQQGAAADAEGSAGRVLVVEARVEVFGLQGLDPVGVGTHARGGLRGSGVVQLSTAAPWPRSFRKRRSSRRWGTGGRSTCTFGAKAVHWVVSPGRQQ